MIQGSDTCYELLDRRGKKVHNCQREFYEEAMKALNSKKSTVREERQFIPLTGESLKGTEEENPS